MKSLCAAKKFMAHVYRCSYTLVHCLSPSCSQWASFTRTVDSVHRATVHLCGGDGDEKVQCRF